MRAQLAGIAAVIMMTAAAVADAQSSATAELAPAGRLRVGLIGSNPVLVTLSPDGKIGGVSVAFGKFIADRLGVPFEPVVYADPAAYTQSFDKGEWDIGIAAKDPARAEKLDFTPDFMLVDNLFLAAPGRRFGSAAEVDRPGIRIAVGKNNAADHFLTGSLKSAELVRIGDDPDSAVNALQTGAADAFAGNGLQCYWLADRIAGAVVVPESFHTVHMAVAVPKGRPAAAALAQIVSEANKTGIVAKAIAAAGLRGVRPVSE